MQDKVLICGLPDEVTVPVACWGVDSAVALGHYKQLTRRKQDIILQTIIDNFCEKTSRKEAIRKVRKDSKG